MSNNIGVDTSAIIAKESEMGAQISRRFEVQSVASFRFLSLLGSRLKKLTAFRAVPSKLILQSRLVHHHLRCQMLLLSMNRPTPVRSDTQVRGCDWLAWKKWIMRWSWRILSCHGSSRYRSHVLPVLLGIVRSSRHYKVGGNPGQKHVHMYSTWRSLQ